MSLQQTYFQFEFHVTLFQWFFLAVWDGCFDTDCVCKSWLSPKNLFEISCSAFSDSLPRPGVLHITLFVQYSQCDMQPLIPTWERLEPGTGDPQHSSPLILRLHTNFASCSPSIKGSVSRDFWTFLKIIKYQTIFYLRFNFFRVQ